MIIKKNEEEARKFLNEFKNYGLNEEKLCAEKQLEIDIIKKKHIYSGEPLTKELVDNFMEKYRIKEAKTVEFCESVNKLIYINLKKYSQRMLIYLFNSTTNIKLQELISSQIKINNEAIKLWNTIYSESGEIFELLNDMSIISRQDMLDLIEATDELEFNGKVLHNFSPVTRNYIEKSFYSDLNSEKKSFCIDRDIVSEDDFQSYKQTFLKRYELVLLHEIDNIFNKTTGNEELSLSESLYSSKNKGNLSH